MSILDSIFGGGGGKNPVHEANNYLNQIPGQAHTSYDDYITKCKESGGNVHQAFQDMMSDPQGFINKIMGGYQESDAYKYQKDKLGTAMSNTAAAGGIAGTPLDQMTQGEQIQKLLSGDQQQWLQNVLGRFDKGLGGESDEATRGYDASGKLNDVLGGALNQQGGLAFQGTQADNAQHGANQKAFMSFLAKALGGLGGWGSQDTGSIFGHNLWGGQNGN